MKSQFFVLLSGVLTLGFGYWLAEQSRDAREIWVAMGAWILGFWFASSILGIGSSRGSAAAAGELAGEDEDENEDEEYDEEDEEER